MEQCQGRVTGLCLLPRGIQLDFVADTGVPVERRNRELCGIRVNLQCTYGLFWCIALVSLAGLLKFKEG